MTWTAPEVDRSTQTIVGDERVLLDSMLDHMRSTVRDKCARLTEDQLKTQPLDYTNLSLLGLIRHLADVELFWFRINLNREEVPGYYHRMDDAEVAWEQAPHGEAQRDFANYAQAVENSRAIAAKYDLDATFQHVLAGSESTLRWIYLHLIREYSRHCGHADLLREAIDGSTGV